MDDGYLAEIRGFAGNFAPRKWAFCAGQMLPISTNQALYSLLGTMYGGDGRTSFALPDLRGRVPISQGRHPGSNYNFDPGDFGGSEFIQLDTNQLPTHNHIASTAGGSATLIGSVSAKMKVNNDESEGKSPSGQYLSVSSSPDIYAGNDTGDTLNDNAITVDTSQLRVQVSGIQVQVQNAGKSSKVGILQPFLAISWIICTDGLYPSRN